MSGSIGQTYARSFDGSGLLLPATDADEVSDAGGDWRAHAQAATMPQAAMSCAVRRMVHCTLWCAFVILASARLGAHDPSSVPITWNREISRVVFDRCASCHRPGGTAFSLMTYKDAQPRADAIKASVISRRMPPWGAVKGFGDFRNDSSLTQEQISLFVDWVEGAAPRGNNPNALPPVPTFDRAPTLRAPSDGVVVSGELKLDRAMSIDGILPVRVAAGRQTQVVAAVPGGAIVPLLWLYEYNEKYQHPFLYRQPIQLPAGTTIRGVRSDEKLLLLPATTSWFRWLFGGSTR